MCDCKNCGAVLELLENDLIWEVIDRHLPRDAISPAKDRSASIRKLLEQAKRSVHFIEESVRKFGIPVAIPADCLSQIALRNSPKANRLHRDKTSWRISLS